MADVVIKYNDTEASMSASGTKTCKTSGKYCEGNIVVEYTRPNTSVQSKNAYPTDSDQTINPDSGYIGIAPVVVKKVITTNLSASNIANGVTIKVGREDDAGAIASVTGTAVLLVGEAKGTVTQNSQSATYTPSSGYNGITSVTVSAKSGSATPSASITQTGSAGNNYTAKVTPSCSVGTSGWISSISNGTAISVTPANLGATTLTASTIGVTNTGLYTSVTVSNQLSLQDGEMTSIYAGEESNVYVYDTINMEYPVIVNPYDGAVNVEFANEHGWEQYVYFNTSSGRATIDNLVASNIKNGVNIFGITGTLASGGKTGISAGGFWTTPSHTYSSTSGTIYRRTLSTTTFGGYYVLGQSSTTGTYNLYSNGYSLPKNSAIWIGRSDYKYSTSSAGSCSSGHSCNIYLYNTGSKIYILAGSQYIYGSGNISPLVDIVIGSSVSSISFTYYGGSSSSITRYSYMYLSNDVGGGSGQKEYCCIPSSASDTYTNSLKNIYYSVTSSSMSVSINMSSITWDE